MKKPKNKYILFPNLVMAMGKNGDSIESLATKLEMNKMTLSRRLNGVTQFTLPEVKKLIEIYEQPFDKLFHTNEEIEKEEN